MPAAISPTSNGHAMSEHPAIQQSQQEEERLRQLWAKALVCETNAPSQELMQRSEENRKGRECRKARGAQTVAEDAGMLGEESTTALSPEVLPPSPELLPMAEPEWSGPQMPVAISPTSNGHAMSEQPAIQQSEQEGEMSRQLWAKALVCETTAPSQELLPPSPE